ncbi:MAG: hypothetical protein LBN38_03810, partial [Verrucomicrobiota bacterium]|nr:hypothetical protein [Verrucomicrobiota bacterium]
PSLLLYGIPVLVAGIFLLRARNAISRTPFVPPNMVPFLQKLRTAFACIGWFYILILFFAILLLLLYVGGIIHAATAADSLPFVFSFFGP